jgi:hypothetical protein
VIDGAKPVGSWKDALSDDNSILRDYMSDYAFCSRYCR